MILPLYGLAAAAATPLLRRKLARRGIAEPGYLEAVEERFGRYAQAGPPGAVWIHAVSLGETRAAAILIAALREARPGVRILLTHGTATGRAEGRKLLREGDAQAWLPWDAPGPVRRFLMHFRPSVGVLMETEIWPQLLAQARSAGVPMALANARLNEASLRGALRLRWLSRPAYASLAAVWAQTDADAVRLARVGAAQPIVMGNVKFDAEPDARLLARGQAWRAALDRPVVLFASSREGEEAPFLEVLTQAQGAGAVQWLLVPRHPQRFDEVAALAAQAGWTVSRRSTWQDGAPVPAPNNLWLGDSLGEMALYYGLADVALLGGSFAELGGQNLIEANACGCPVVMGPHTFNFAEAAELSARAGGAVRVTSMREGVEQALALVTQAGRRAAASAAATEFATAHRGAARRTARAILALMPISSSR